MKETILVTGANGLVGHAIQKHLGDSAIYLNREDGDLRDPSVVKDIFHKYRPAKVIHLAAVVGGVKSNMRKPADFYADNILINTNVLINCSAFAVEKVISYMSTCVFPDSALFPLTTDQLHKGAPHGSNFGYAFAKRMLDVQSRALRKQVGINSIIAIPTNIYGPHDNFHLEDGHVLPALIHRMYLARERAEPLTVWGSGRPLREFVYADDIAKLSIWALDNYNKEDPLIFSSGIETSIYDAVHMIARRLMYEGEIKFDTAQPDGQYRKPSSHAELSKFNPRFQWTTLEDGLDLTIEWFLKNLNSAKGVTHESV